MKNKEYEEILNSFDQAIEKYRDDFLLMDAFYWLDVKSRIIKLFEKGGFEMKRCGREDEKKNS